jgi:hypothetical protein
VTFYYPQKDVMIAVGILADTLISSCTETFQSITRKVFFSCDEGIRPWDFSNLRGKHVVLRGYSIGMDDENELQTIIHSLLFVI